MFLKEKYTSLGEFSKLKSRLVAGGHMQDRSELLYEDICAPTVALSHLFIIAAIAAREKRCVSTIDIGGAYFNADIASHDIYMELDPIMSAFLVNVSSYYASFLNERGVIRVKLLKALYGCIESAKLWYDMLSSTLIQDGFLVNALDPCVFNKMIASTQITVLIYVDDIFVSCINPQYIRDFQHMLIVPSRISQCTKVSSSLI